MRALGAAAAVAVGLRLRRRLRARRDGSASSGSARVAPAKASQSRQVECVLASVVTIFLVIVATGLYSAWQLPPDGAAAAPEAELGGL